MLFACTINQQAYATAPQDIYPFTESVKQQQFNQLLVKLRCLVCQNQNLSDSNASLAKDLRGLVYNMVQQGYDDRYIMGFLTSRYGDFILFEPPVKQTTYLLWFAPFVLFIAAIMILLLVIYRRNLESELKK